MASVVGRAYNGGMGAMPQWCLGAKPLVRRQSHLKLKAILKLIEQYCALDLTIWTFRYFIYNCLFVI